MAVRERTIESLMLEDPGSLWELLNGDLREKPPMSIRHGGVMSYLDHLLQQQLDRAVYRVHPNHARLRLPSGGVYVPDVVVIPVELMRPTWDRPDGLDLYSAPMPLVVEVWSPSTGTFDVRSKVADYQQRGDLEIWFLHPFERTLTAWRRQPDGSYTEELYRSGPVRPVALPDVTIDLDTLFE